MDGTAYSIMLGNREKISFTQIHWHLSHCTDIWVPAATSDVIIVCSFFKKQFPATYRAQFEIDYFFGKKFLARHWSCQNSRESFDKELGASVLKKNELKQFSCCFQKDVYSEGRT